MFMISSYIIIVCFWNSAKRNNPAWMWVFSLAIVLLILSYAIKTTFIWDSELKQLEVDNNFFLWFIMALFELTTTIKNFKESKKIKK